MIKIGKINLDCDFEYRTIREEDDDLDLYVDVNYRCLDINLGDDNFFNSRIQFPFVGSILLRINKKHGNYYCSFNERYRFILCICKL